VLSQWQGRGQLEDVPFPSEFFASSGQLTTLRKSAEKEAEQLKSIFARLQPGVYLACLFISNEEIMADSNGLLPMVQLSNVSYENVDKVDYNGKEFEWLTGLSKNWSAICAAFATNIDKRKSENTFVRGIVKAAKVLVDKFEMDIGKNFHKFANVQEFCTID
jgi:predicted chitinase